MHLYFAISLRGRRFDLSLLAIMTLVGYEFADVLICTLLFPCAEENETINNNNKLWCVCWQHERCSSFHLFFLESWKGFIIWK